MKSIILVAVASLAIFLPSASVKEGGVAYTAPQPKNSLKTPEISSQAPLEKTYQYLLGGNDYTPGNCTWGVARWTPVIAGLGNAADWDENAAYYGVPVSDTPRVVAVAQRDGGLGHVAVVEAIDGNMVLIHEMNSAGLYSVDTKWVSASTYRYLYF